MPKTSFLLLVLLTAGCWDIAVSSSSSNCKHFNPSRKNAVKHLPGFNADSLPSRHYTGYIPVQNGEHQLWYWLVESEGSPSEDPVILWLTGGPGCSSMDALIYEHGPFSFTEDEAEGPGQQAGAAQTRCSIKLTRNPYSWSKTATIIYVDAPVGTGLSFSSKQKTYETDDEATTDDLLDFITQLLQYEFPQLLNNDLYIAGESYAGVFVPMLATKLLHYNQQALRMDRLNLKGYTVGNGVTDDMFDGNGQPEFAYAMGLLDPPTYSQLQRICNGNFWNATADSTCAKQLHDAYDRFYWLNPYDILEDCFTPEAVSADGYRSQASHLGSSLREQQIADKDARQGSSARHLKWFGQQRMHSHLQLGKPKLRQARSGTTGAAPQPSSYSQSKQHQSMGSPVAAALAANSITPIAWPLAGVRGSASMLKTWYGMLGHSVPCSDRRVALAWMNDADVRAALHAPPVGCIQWQPCSDRMTYHFVPISMIPHHLNALQQGLRVMIYSGDHDFVVPFTGTRDWIYSLQLPITRPYAPWTIDGQVAGFMVEFASGLQFVTVKGAGHMVPQTNPSRALHLITRFLYANL